jgi:hypothetical protein
VAPVAGAVAAGVVELVDPVEPVEPVEAALATAAPPPAKAPTTTSAVSSGFIGRIIASFPGGLLAQ